ncbi:MAG: hypothetical protein ACRDQZ_06065 [Mycobacteriales bacterium]
MTNLERVLLFAVVASSSAGASFGESNDPYIWLEDAHGAKAMAWVEAENAKSTAVLEKDPRYAGLYQDALAIVQAKDRVPNPNVLAGAVYNFWQDADHVRGIWRKTTLASYRNAGPAWATVLDLDALAKTEQANWFLKGTTCVEPREQRCLLSLSDGGEDAVTVKEFDLGTDSFSANGFVLPKGKQRVAWEDEDTLLVSREWAPGELTTSGYPFIVKRVKRGTPLLEAKEIFRGTSNDGGYGVTPIVLKDGAGNRAVLITRPLSTFESEDYLMTGGKVAQLALPKKADIQALVAGKLVLSLNEDWVVGGRTFSQGSLVAFDVKGAARDPVHLKVDLIYKPGPRESFSDASATRDALIITTFDNVRGRASVYRPGTH